MATSLRATEAHPIPLDELAKFERDLLMDVNERINVARAEKLKPAKSADEKHCWTEISPERFGGIIVLDGDRGTGKTSLLLTILDEWLKGWSRKAARVDPNANKDAADLESRLRETGRNIRPLKILEFDPLPDGLCAHAWLLQPWKQVIKVHGKSAASGKGVLDDSLTLSDKWDVLFQRAAEGWSSSSEVSRSMIERVQDYRERADAWFLLQREWHEFVDEVYEVIQGLEKPTSTIRSSSDNDALIVVPIDDVDLQCERLPELMHALRLFRHPRVVYLLTAHIDHAREAVTLDYLGRHLQLVKTQLGDTPVAQREWSRLHSRSLKLANTQIDKTFPAVNRIPVPSLSLQDALALPGQQGSIKDVLNQRKKETDDESSAREGLAEPLRSLKTLGDVLAKISDIRDGHPIDDLTTFRHLQQTLDSAVSDSTVGDDAIIKSRKAAALAISALVGVPLQKDGLDLKISELAKLSLAPRAAWESDRVVDGRILTGWDLKPRAPHNLGEFQNPNSLYLALILKELKTIKAPSIGLSFNELFVWTEWDTVVAGGRARFVYVWPSVRLPTILQLHFAIRWWRETVLPSVTKAGGERNAHLLSWWLRLQLKWLLNEPLKGDDKEISLKDLPKEVEATRARLNEVKATRAKRKPKKFVDWEERLRHLNEWIKDLRYVALPEYLLEENKQGELLKACMDCEVPGLSEKLQGKYRQQLAASAIVASSLVSDESTEIGDLQSSIRGDFESVASEFLTRLNRTWPGAPALARLDPPLGLDIQTDASVYEEKAVKRAPKKSAKK